MSNFFGCAGFFILNAFRFLLPHDLSYEGKPNDEVRVPEHIKDRQLP